MRIDKEWKTYKAFLVTVSASVALFSTGIFLVDMRSLGRNRGKIKP